LGVWSYDKRPLHVSGEYVYNDVDKTLLGGGKIKIKFEGEPRDVVILLHEGIRDSVSVDILAKKEFLEKHKRIKKTLEDAFNYVSDECPFVEEFLKKYKSYELLASDDLAHIFIFNCAVLYRLLEIYRRYKTGIVIAYEGGEE